MSRRPDVPANCDTNKTSKPIFVFNTQCLFLVYCVSNFCVCCFIAVEVKVEMELVVTNYVFKEELKNKSSPVYKETEKNFTEEVKSLL